ncbi:hypothetical protein FIU97_10240 [Roseivivax sp. THAF40]|uniref:STAS domain-containing protein n=1 Tax=unclassified Roseivivax TaxID=2639302 RepID=UPI001267C57B|nr:MULTISPECIES: STAS domain-containing protein [unclassified Roseivivax]QFS83207.1 hypothetical protein FIV09_10255 [Roseivivax sp. THAF197b]QFT46951.1 hypothetical protein FIU97_10240 [Roseivivax sp. THAF40]
MSEVIDLPKKLDTSMAEGLSQRLKRARTGDLLIDGRRVQSLGTLCAQALVGAYKYANSNSQKIKILASEAMRDDLRLLGLSMLIEPETDLENGEME